VEQFGEPADGLGDAQAGRGVLQSLKHDSRYAEKVRLKGAITACAAHDGKRSLFSYSAGARDAAVHVMMDGEILEHYRCEAFIAADISDSD
jgi:hypothetical protein